MQVQAIELPAAHALAARLCGLPGVCWLDGEASHADGRYSFLGAEPVERIVRVVADREPLSALDALEPSAPAEPASGTALGAPPPSEVPRWVGYIAYDAAFAGGAGRAPRPPERPVLCFARYDALLAIDHRERRAFVVGDDARACARLQARLRGQSSALHAHAGAIRAAPPERHLLAIAHALERIACGDVYQVNLARCFSAAFDGQPLALFLALRAASPVPFGFYFEDGRRAIAARTMERFLRWERASGRLCSRPIKGTFARRGGRDAHEARALRSDQKERAEHAMIVDLMRNDLGRVARTGSVAVPDVMAVEGYAGLHHLVSTVACRTRTGIRLRDVLEATFPPGSVTGAPKLAAIDLIEALEPVARDAYTGALGYVDRTGGLSLAVAIRTALVGAGEVRYFAGGGIVEASDPARELRETELKAAVFRTALLHLPRSPRPHPTQPG